MISGILAISIAFIAATVTTAAYWLYYKSKNIQFYNLANYSFTIMGIGILFSVVLLYFNIITHNFQLNYVYSYTSIKLSTYYLISTFWAGQEGTFLLWLFFGIFYGIVLIRTLGKKEPMVLFFLMLVQSFILLILLKKSPFAMIWHIHPEVSIGFIPIDGAGLNPLLQNPWMIIHPPIMFIGYSSSVVAFALVMNAMVKKEFNNWVKDARPWVIFATLTLGAGIILGGYWSYVTLGWGGYWAWDPVENASLVPWVFAGALLHGLIIQTKQNGLIKMNLLLSGLVFLSVLWGSFLTRSGVLSDFSVHSFADSDLNLYLVAFVTFFSGMFLYFYFKSIKLISSPKFAEGILSRETFILVGMMTLIFTGIIVFIGTSSPIYTSLLGKPANTPISFYNLTSIPITVFMLGSIAIAPLLIWNVSELRNKKTFITGLIGAVIITLVSYFLGLTKPVSIILVFLSLFVVLTNGVVFYGKVRRTPAKIGSYLSHIGVGMMIIGIITSSMYNRSEKIVLPAGKLTKTDLGHEIKFVEFQKRKDGKDRMQMIVKNQDGTYKADPEFYFSEYTQSYMLAPHVKVGLKKDIYISPISYTPGAFADVKHIDLHKHQSVNLDSLSFTFHKFIVGEHMDQSPMTVKADLTVSIIDDEHKQEYNVTPALWMENGKMSADEVNIPTTDYKIRLEQIDANEGLIHLAVLGLVGNPGEIKDVLAIELSEKPLISILWFGCIIMMLGISLSLIERMKKAV